MVSCVSVNLPSSLLILSFSELSVGIPMPTSSRRIQGLVHARNIYPRGYYTAFFDKYPHLTKMVLFKLMRLVKRGLKFLQA